MYGSNAVLLLWIFQVYASTTQHMDRMTPTISIGDLVRWDKCSLQSSETKASSSFAASSILAATQSRITSVARHLSSDQGHGP
ncbi:hypothetical protein QR685DRAFT_153298 [Neurospora intermedia]|uniref:Secreted protein n=1 Tax=Neurospora intermedia TaxID=5142 RepID=A0ABR3DJ96_NEUIN